MRTNLKPKIFKYQNNKITVLNAANNLLFLHKAGNRLFAEVIDHGLFEFPKGFPLEKRLKDVLETEVDEKFYMDDTNVGKLMNLFDVDTASASDKLFHELLLTPVCSE